MKPVDLRQKIRNIIRSSPDHVFVWNPYSWRKLDYAAGRMLKRKELVRIGKRRPSEVFLTTSEVK